MIFLTLIFLSLSRSTASYALSSNSGLLNHLVHADTYLFYPRSDADLLTGSRSIWDIVQSCLATIFACTWIAVHPNIPAPEDGEGRVVARRLAIMGYMLLAPEAVIMWTTRQYIAAAEISRRHHDKGWTKVHAFFLIMGGFMLYDKGEPLRTLECGEFEELLDQGKIDWPSISEEEINDKSKGDYLSKAVVILQTGWFIAQCIARGVNKLAVTELEVATLAFSMITMVIYIFWWHKPLDVKVPYPIPLKELAPVEDDLKTDLRPSAVEPDSQMDVHVQTSTENPSTLDAVDTLAYSDPREAQPNSSASDQRHPSPSTNTGFASPTRIRSYTVVTEHDVPHPEGSPHDAKDLTQGYKARFLALLHRQQRKHGVWRGTAFVLFIYPFVPFFGAFQDMLQCTSLDGKQFRVPSFYAPESEREEMAIFLGFLVALAFGGIHCIAWSFYFPSVAERWIWRISAVLVSCTPVAVVILSILISGDVKEKSAVGKFLEDFFAFVAFLSLCIYMLARLLLLVLPLLELRALSPSAYIDLNWTALFPHI